MDYQGGADVGGGYGGGPSQSEAPSSQGRTRKSYDEQTLVPVTIRMILRSQPDTAGGDGSLVLEDGRNLASIKLVGAVRNVENHSTNVVYTLEDGTGLIEVKQWMDDNESSMMQELRDRTLKEHIYLKIIGQIKDYEGNKIIVANSVRPLSSGNELTHHMLEVVYSGERYKRADSIVAAPPMPMNNGIGFGGQPVTASHGIGGGATGSENPLKAAVLNIFDTRDDSGQGVHVQVCVDALNHSFPEAQVRKMIESLSEEGHIYSTVSDAHFQFAR